MRRLLWLASLPLLAQGLCFTPEDALRAEWSRQPPAFTVAQTAGLPAADRARLDRTLRRLGAPGAPALLPPELAQPTLAAWEVKAAAARTPPERFTALFMLNRLKSPRALAALAGLGPRDAAAWPKHLHLEAAVATARLNGGEPPPELEAFLAALGRAGKSDPVRAQAARLRLVMGGKEAALLPPVRATPGSLLALLDAWNRTPWALRRGASLEALRDHAATSPLWARLGVTAPSRSTLDRSCVGIQARLGEGLPTPAPAEAFPADGQPWPCAGEPLAQWWSLQGLAKAREPLPHLLPALAQEPPFGLARPDLQGALLPVLRHQDPRRADALRDRLLAGPDALGRAAAIEDLQAPPTDLQALVDRVWRDPQFEAQQALIHALERWDLAPPRRKALLEPWLAHPDWACRREAHQALVKLEPATPWPGAPEPGPADRAILAEASRLMRRGRPVRLRITFEGHREVTLRLDPLNAPLNTANLVLLARKGFFDGRRVPRVVPDFVVQMGSPVDTMDGGPGHTVRCEDSLDWYGPGSVGMALSGKDTGGSQFFITTNATPHLTGRYTRVGQVEDPDRALPLLDALELGAKILRVQELRD